MPDPTICGGEPCNKIVDRLGALMAEQSASGFRAVKELMTIHHETLKVDITELKQALGKQGDEIFPRLRKLEGQVEVMEAVGAATALSETKVKEIIATNETFVWLARRRWIESKIIIGLVTALVLGVITAGIAMYAHVENQKNKIATKSQGE
jgi:hypothetical protein